MKEKEIILAARIFSMVFTPFYLPIVGLAALFLFSYLGLMPLGYKLTVLGLVYLFTILLPTYIIRLYRHYQGWKPFDFIVRERRLVPYVIYTSFHGQHPCSCGVDTGGLRPHQCVV